MKDVEIKLHACIHTRHKNAIGELGTLTADDLEQIEVALELKSEWSWGDEAKATDQALKKVEAMRDNLHRWAIEQEIKD